MSPEVWICKGTKAVELAQQLDQLSSGKTLTAVAMLTASFAEAVVAAQSALKLADGKATPDVTDALQAQLQLYQSHTPLRRNVSNP